MIIIIIAGVFAVISAQKFFNLRVSSPSSYQAVFLTNGQVYFGKLSEKGEKMILRNVYYLRAENQQLQPNLSADQPNMQLIKLGSELHGPQDEMFIERGQILFWENMKEDSQVVKAIQQYNGL